MARGGPDFGAVSPRTLTAPALDPGELAVRLGSLVEWDRQGTVIGLIGGGGLGRPRAGAQTATEQLDVVSARGAGGGYALRLRSGAAASIPATEFYVPYLGEAGTGVEAVWTRGANDAAHIATEVYTDDGTSRFQGGIRWNATDNDWEYLNSAGAYVNTPTQPEDITEDVPVNVKVVVDPATGLYVRGLVGGVSVAIGGIAARPRTQVARLVLASFYLEGLSATVTTVWLSHIIVTTNEA